MSRLGQCHPDLIVPLRQNSESAISFRSIFGSQVRNAKLDSTIEALGNAERVLRRSIAAEAKDADSERISVFVGWLKDLRRILREAESYGGKLPIPLAVR